MYLAIACVANVCVGLSAGLKGRSPKFSNGSKAKTASIGNACYADKPSYYPAIYLSAFSNSYCNLIVT